jgi:hypothetical protein
VLGGVDDLPAIIQREEVEFCLLGVPATSHRGVKIIDFCRERGIELHQDLDTPVPTERLGAA